MYEFMYNVKKGGFKMSIAKKIQMVVASAGLNNRKMSAAFGCSENTAAAKFQRGIKSIDDLILICNYCGANLNITTKDGTIIPLTLDDVEKE